MLGDIDAQSLTKRRPSGAYVVDVLSGTDARSERGQDANDKTPNLGTRTETHDFGGLLSPGEDSSGNPNARLGDHGFKPQTPIADENHPDTFAFLTYG